MSEAARSAASAAAGAVASRLAAATSPTAAGAFAATLVSITETPDHHEELELPQEIVWCRSWGGGITPHLGWEGDLFECSADRSIRILGPGPKRFQKLGTKASEHRVEHKHKREPTQGISGLLQQR